MIAGALFAGNKLLMEKAGAERRMPEEGIMS